MVFYWTTKTCTEWKYEIGWRLHWRCYLLSNWFPSCHVINLIWHPWTSLGNNNSEWKHMVVQNLIVNSPYSNTSRSNYLQIISNTIFAYVKYHFESKWNSSAFRNLLISLIGHNVNFALRCIIVLQMQSGAMLWRSHMMRTSSLPIEQYQYNWIYTNKMPSYIHTPNTPKHHTLLQVNLE